MCSRVVGMPSNSSLNLNSSLLELVEAFSGSLRLRGGLKLAADRGRLPFNSIREYSLYPGNPVEKILILERLGRSSAYELHRLVGLFFEKTKTPENDESPEVFDNCFDINILKILECYPTSNKLINLFSQQLEKLPYESLGEYLEKGEYASSEILAYDSVGRKTAFELKGKIERFIIDNKLNISKYKREKVSPLDLEADTSEILECVSIDDKDTNTSLLDLVNSVPCSVRLKNCIVNNFYFDNFPYRTIGEYIKCGKSASNLILHFKNSGKKTAKELDEIICKYLNKNNIQIESNEQKAKYISELIVYLMEELTQRQSDILSLRYGFNGKHKKTLEEVGQELGLTRERIRQLEVKAVKKLCFDMFKDQMEDLLSANAGQIYRAISNEYGIVKERDFPLIKKTLLPGEHLLFMEIVFGSFEKWLDNIAVKVSGGWYRGPFNSALIDNCLENINSSAKKFSLPALAQTIKSLLHDDENLIDVAISLHRDWVLLKGIVFEKPVGSRRRRQARLYELLYNKPQSLSHLIEIHNTAYPEEKCSFRDALIVMSDAPQLFVSLGDDDWATVGWVEQREFVEFKTKLSFAGRYDEDTSSADQTEEVGQNLVSFIRQLLKETGPIHFVQLRDLFVERSRGRYMPNSLGPVLICYGEFVRLAPGVYGLKDSMGNVESAFLKTDILLNNIDCTNYVISRWAGESVGSYPLWTYAMEYVWCKWAREHASLELLNSLLVVCEPNCWSVSYEEKAYWLALKQKDGFYRLDADSRYFLHDKPPTLRELYCFLIAIEQLSNLNWIRVNRILGRRNSDNHAAAVLAVLIGLGVILPPRSWQLPHVIETQGTKYKTLRDELSRALAPHGKLPWTSPIGLQLLNRLQKALLTEELGWVDQDQFQHLIQKLSEGRGYDAEDNSSDGMDQDTVAESSLEILLIKNQQKKLNAEFSSVLNSLLYTS